ncbi:phytanoyl-CoA dioxygenase family protein [Phenylobacterium sp.]|uniref:phytanoyl-CoA dioxygenase family protein n=1 Tax=Phenylobacterium sp. TaxID=1871053 RepID=UPI00286D1D69|nr:phytanoyl-CoA dioxygenase family protein [Phenylobacterium sp.]
MPELITLSAAAHVDEVTAALARDGAVILDRAFDETLRGQIFEETRRFVDVTEPGRDGFSGRQTTRTGALVTRAPAVRDLVVDPRILAVCDQVLSPYCQRYQLHLTQMIGLGPGQPAQPLHRDRQVWGTYLTGIEPQLNTIWAMTDFTIENGATRVVPGSQTWDWDRRPTETEITQAVMPAGSVLIYTGSVIHGGGENRTEAVRYGLNIDYSLAWLRQEENQYLSCPPHLARQFSPELQALVGYAMGDYVLGYFSPAEPVTGQPDNLPPQAALDPSFMTIP